RRRRSRRAPRRWRARRGRGGAPADGTVAGVAHLDELLAPLTADPSRAGVLCDFDGSLAPIVEDPAAARPVDGAVDALAALAERYAVVAVISGRPVSFLRTVLPESLRLVGLYGLEHL